MITLDSPEGEVNIGYQKNAILLLRLSKLSVGAEVELDIERSRVEDGANLYVNEGDAFQTAMLRAKQFEVQNKMVENQLLSLGL